MLSWNGVKSGKEIFMITELFSFSWVTSYIMLWFISLSCWVETLSWNGLKSGKAIFMITELLDINLLLHQKKYVQQKLFSASSMFPGRSHTSALPVEKPNSYHE